MDGLKKFLTMFCMTAILICAVGCGSDSSDKIERIEPIYTEISHLPPVTIYPPTYLGITPESFVEAYNGKLDDNSPLKIVAIDSGNNVCFFKVNHPDYSISGQTSQNGYLGAVTLRGPYDKVFLAEMYIVAEIFGRAGGTQVEKIMNGIADTGIYDVGAGDEGAIYALQTYGSEALFVITHKDLKNDAENLRRVEEGRQKAEEFLHKREQAKIAKHQTGRMYNSIYSIGKIGIGSSLDQVHQMLGQEKNIRPSEKISDVSFYEYEDIVIGIEDGWVVRVATYTDKPQTEKGLKQGDKLDKVLSTYGRTFYATKYGDFLFYEYPFERASDEYEIIRFAVKDDVVEYISLREANGEEIQKLSSKLRSF